MAWIWGHRSEFKSESPIIQRVNQLLVGDPGVLDGIGRIGVTELSLNCCDIAGFLYEVPAHGTAGVMRRVTFDVGQAAYLVEHRVDHSGIQPAAAVGVGGRRKKQRRWFPFLKIDGSFFDHLV